MNVLFICSANKDRSKTAEDHFSEIYTNYHFDSAGTNKKICNSLGTNYIEDYQLDWADKIYVMENKHLMALQTIYGNAYYNKVNIRDVYKYGSKELIDILEKSITL